MSLSFRHYLISIAQQKLKANFYTYKTSCPRFDNCRVYPKNSERYARANIIDSYQTSQFAVSDKCLHFLPLNQQFLKAATFLEILRVICKYVKKLMTSNI